MSDYKPVKGFLPLPVTLPALANLPESVHLCYVKPHMSKQADEQADTTRSLFVINPLPGWDDVKLVRALVSQVSSGSRVESVLVREAKDEARVSSCGSGVNYDLHINLSMLSNEEFGRELEDDEKLPFGSSVVSFIDRDALELFLTNLAKFTKGKKKLVWDVTHMQTGLSKYTQIPHLSERTVMEKRVAKALVDFQNRERNAEEELKNMKNVVDEDGFTLVVGSAKKTKAEILGSIKKKSDLEQDVEFAKKSKSKEKEDFYRFQIRERKKQEMNSLLSKFKEDQERVRVMRQKRKFRPY